jgi:hypothetical protein
LLPHFDQNIHFVVIATHRARHCPDSLEGMHASTHYWMSGYTPYLLRLSGSYPISHISDTHMFREFSYMQSLKGPDVLTELLPVEIVKAEPTKCRGSPARRDCLPRSFVEAAQAGKRVRQSMVKKISLRFLHAMPELSNGTMERWKTRVPSPKLILLKAFSSPICQFR